MKRVKDFFWDKTWHEVRGDSAMLCLVGLYVVAIVIAVLVY